MRFRIDGYLPDLNKYIDAERRNRFIAAKLKKLTTESVYSQTLQYAGLLTKFPVDIYFEWHSAPNRGKHLDHDNRCFSRKFILDGLVNAGVLPNDDHKYVGNFKDVFIVDAENYVIVEL